MKQSSINSSRCEASRSPSRSSVHWLWFAAARPAVYWSIDRETARHPQREPKSRHPAHEWQWTSFSSTKEWAVMMAVAVIFLITSAAGLVILSRGTW